VSRAALLHLTGIMGIFNVLFAKMVWKVVTIFSLSVGGVAFQSSNLESRNEGYEAM
jgi:hypothetical protein